MAVMSNQQALTAALDELMKSHQGAVGGSISKRRAPPPAPAMEEEGEMGEEALHGDILAALAEAEYREGDEEQTEGME